MRKTTFVRLNSTAAMFAANPRKFRLRKDENGEHGNDGGDNNDGNSAPNQGDQSNQNNNGQRFDPNGFWSSPSGDDDAAPNGRSAGDTNRSDGHQGGGQDEGNLFNQRLESMNFGVDVFTPDAVEAMNSGDPSQFNGNMANFGKSVTRQSVIMAAQLMQRNNELIEQRVNEMIEQRFGRQDAETNLSKEFPSYNQPGMKPMIDTIHAQAMKVTKGDKKAALEMTREMLKFQTQSLGGDLGLNNAPAGPGDSLASSTNWEQELLGR